MTDPQEADARVQRAVRASMDGLSGIAVFVLDTDGRVLDCYGGALTRHGYQSAAMMGQLLSDLLPQPVWEHTAPMLQHALAGQPVAAERVSYDRTAEYEVTVTPNVEDGAVVGVTLATREITDLRATQRELAESARRFQALAETSVEGHCRYGADGTLLWASPSMRRVLGRDLDDLIGTRAQQVVHPDDAGIRDGAVAAMLSSGQPQTVEYRAEHGDGTWHWYESTVRGWFDEHDRLLEVHVTTRDVTDRREDDELRRQWQLSFDATSRGIMLTDPYTNIIQRVNSAFAVEHGGVPEDFAGKPLVEVFSPAARERVAELAAYVDRESYLSYITEHVRLDGSIFPVETEVVAARGPDGRLLYRVAYVHDLTEQIERERSEHNAVTLFATALDKAPIGMCLIGLDGRFLRVNEALCRLAGRSEDELLETTFAAHTHPDDKNIDLILIQECLDAKRSGYEIDKRYIRSDGEVIEARLSVELIRDGSGDPLHFVCQIVDLTERTRLEQQLEASVRIARDLLRDVDEDSLVQIAREAAEISRADRALVLLPTRDPDHLQIAVAVGDDVETLVGNYLPMADSLTGEVARTGEAKVLDGETAALAAAVEAHFAPPGGIGPTMVVPLLGESGPRGVLALSRNPGRPAYGLSDLGLARAFAQQAAVALELADARELAQQVELLEDRDRIARDLHDHVIQRLFAAGLTMQSLAISMEPEQAERLTRCIEDIDETITQIRSAIYGLRTPLSPAVSTTRERILEVLGDVTPLLAAAPVVQFAGPLDVMLPDDLVDDLVAVLREALTNVARHAKAGSTRVAIDAQIEARQLVVEVVDDGVGLGPTARRSGLANLRKRAETRGGTFEAESPESGGTRLRWSVPIP